MIEAKSFNIFIDNWTMISEIQSDRLSTDFVWLLGKKSGKAIVQRFDIENMELKPGITTAEEVITPKSLIVDENEISPEKIPMEML